MQNAQIQTQEQIFKNGGAGEDCLAPPPVNLEREIIEVEGKHYLIVYDKKTQTLHAPIEIPSVVYGALKPGLLIVLIVLGLYGWYWIIKLIVWLWRKM